MITRFGIVLLWILLAPFCGCSSGTSDLGGDANGESDTPFVLGDLVPSFDPPSLEELDQRVDELAGKLAKIPMTQLIAMKLIVNQAYDNMGLQSTQTLGPILDGYMRNTPEAHRFMELSANGGASEAIRRRDEPFGDYSQASPERKPNPRNVVAANRGNTVD